jgi:hypothetical protein
MNGGLICTCLEMVLMAFLPRKDAVIRISHFRLDLHSLPVGRRAMGVTSLNHE